MFLVVVSVYAPSVHNDFIYDDQQIIVGHEAPRNIADFARIFAERHFPNLPYYRPVTRFTLLAQKSLHGLDAGPYHLFNAVLMGVAALLAYALLRSTPFAVPPIPALIAAALFTLHPIASSCVYPISSGRETLLPSVWTLAAVYAFLRGGPRWRAAAMLLFAAALFSKEQGIVVPALFVCADVLGLAPDPPGRRFGAWARRYWPVLPIIAIFLAVRLMLFGGGEFVPGSPTEPLLTVLFAIQTIFVPSVPLVYEPTFPIWFSPVRLAVALVLLTALALLVRRDWPLLRRSAWFWMAWFVIALLPSGNLVKQEAHFDERYAFPASFTIFAMAAQWAALHSRAQMVRRYLLPAPALLILIYASISFERRNYFKDDVVFSRQWIRTNPNSVNAHYNLGYALAVRGNPAEAADEYKEALRILPDYATAHCNLANSLSALDKLDEALPHYREALRLDPNYIDAHNNFGIALARKGQFPEAIQQFQEVLQLNPGSATAHNDLGNTFAAQAQYDRAAQEFGEALRLNPDLADAHNNLGNILVGQGQLKRALNEYAQALRIRPGYEDAQRNFALVEAHLRDQTQP